jgi:hypothetical protein
MVYFIVSCVFIFTFVREILFMHERKQWQQERQKLLDRIQAKNLTEYKIMTEPSKPIEKKEEETYEWQ